MDKKDKETLIEDINKAIGLTRDCMRCELKLVDLTELLYKMLNYVKDMEVEENE